MANWAWRERAENRPRRRSKLELVNERTIAFARNFRLEHHDWENVVFQYKRFNNLRTQAYQTAKNRANSDQERNADYAAAVTDIAIECAHHMGVRPPISIIILFTPDSPARLEARENIKTIQVLHEDTPENMRLEEMDVYENYFREANTDIPNTEDPPQDDDDRGEDGDQGGDDDEQPPHEDDNEPPQGDDDEQIEEPDSDNAVQLIDEDEEIQVDYLVDRKKLVGLYNNAATIVNNIQSIFRHPHYRNRVNQQDE